MPRRTAAISWRDFGKDETGTIIDVAYTCPYCGIYNSNMFLVSPERVDIVSKNFETDQTCSECSKKVIVECFDFNKE